jgi:hypothetical protein
VEGSGSGDRVIRGYDLEMVWKWAWLNLKCCLSTEGGF